MSFTLSKTVRSHPRLAYAEIVEDILGTDYNLSLVFIGETRAQSLNKRFRDKSYIPNVLSFPLSLNEGEIYITPSVAKKEARKRDMTYRGYVGFLFIHGLLHLKGYRHGATMEEAEKKYISKHKLR